MQRGLLVVALLFVGAVAAAEPIDPNFDGIGIYADLEGRLNQVEMEEGQPLEAYVLVTRPTGGGTTETTFSGVEFTVTVPDNVTIWGWSTPIPNTMMWLSAPDIMMNFWPALPFADVIHVLTFIIVPANDEPAQFYLGPLRQSGPDVLKPRYSYGSVFELYDLTPYPGGCENMSFVVNGAIVPDETTSWSDVKALYH